MSLSFSWFRSLSFSSSCFSFCFLHSFSFCVILFLSCSCCSIKLMKNGVRRSSFNLESSEWSNVTEVPLPSLSQMVGYKRLEVFNEASMHPIPLFCPLIAYEIEFYVKLIIQSIMSPFLQIYEEYSVIFPFIVKYD